MAAAASDASAKLERLFLRLVSISEDEKLQTFLRTSLLDIIRTMAANDAGAREKGMEILNHLNRRVKSNAEVKFPVDQLLEFLSSSQKDAFTTNFVLVYLKMAANRIAGEEHFSLLPLLLDAMKKNLGNKKAAEQLLILFARCLMYITQFNVDKWPSMSAIEDAALRTFILGFFRSVAAFKDSALYDLKSAVAATEARKQSAPSCLTRENFLFLAKELVIAQQLSIVMLKISVVKLVSSDLFTDEEKLPLLLLAIANGPNDVEFIAESSQKKLEIDSLINTNEMCKQLFTLYLGNQEKGTSGEEVFTGAPLALKLLLLPLFIRSQLASSMFPFNIKVAFDGLFGNMSGVAKLQQLSVEFLLLIIKKCSDSSLAAVGPIIFSSLKKLFVNCEHTSVVSVAYQCFGLIGRKVPNLILKDLQLIQETFDAIPRAPTDIASAIVDCLISWLPGLCDLKDAASAGVLQTIISTYIQHESPKCRLVSLKFVEALVKSPAIEFRWTLCRAVGDTRDEMKREAKRLLELSLQDQQFVPKIEDMVEYFYRKLKFDQPFAHSESTDGNEAKRRKGAFDGEVLAMTARYLFACACVSSGQTVTLSSDLQREIYPSVSEFLSTVNEHSPNVIDMFITICFYAIESQPVSDILDIAVILLQSNNGRLNMASRKELLVMVSNEMVSSARQNVCAILALLYVTCLDDEEKRESLEASLRKLSERYDFPPGELWVVSYLTCQRFPQLSVQVIHDIQMSIFQLMEPLVSQPSPLFGTACSALAESYRRCLDNLNKDERAELCSLRKPEFLRVIDQIGKTAVSRKDTVDSKAKEAAVKCLGFLSTLYYDDELYDQIIFRLFAIGEGPPLPELQFNVGDSLFDAAFGEFSASRRNLYSESEERYIQRHLNADDKASCEKRALVILDKVITEKLYHTNRHLRQSAFIWLFVFVKRCVRCRLSIVDERLRVIQNSFISGLGENDDFTQEISSQGLGVVFDLGSDEEKKAMVSELIEFLTTGRKSVVPITGETQLFAKGELGVGPSGESLTTYKELCALATDLNQPDLIYKFMQLANHSALYNSKKGAAYGFNIVMQQAKSELEPFLPQIVPKLYRYRYDPDPKVMLAMRNLWQVLTSAKKNVVEEHAGLIMRELLPTLTSPLWRTREASCLAVADLLSGHNSDTFVESAGQLFEILFRINDDVKESVRLSAKKALSSLIKFSMRNSVREKGDAATRFIGIILPVIIEKGMRSSYKENRLISLKAVMDLSKEAGPALQPHLVTIVPCLLEALSEAEPTWLNYLAARSDADELETLDTARASAARSSPMVSTLHDLIPVMSESAIESLCPVLCDLLRNSVGVSTRLGTCQFLIDLCLRCRQSFFQLKPTCDKFLHTLMAGLRDRNPAVRKQFSVAASYIVKYCSEKQTDRLIKFIKEKLQGDQADDEMTVFNLLRALADNNSETLNDIAASVVPHVFLISSRQVEKTDESGKKKLALWEELWTDLVPGTDSAIRLYKKEMLEVVFATMQENPVWAKRAESAAMLSRIIKSVGDGLTAAEAGWQLLRSST